MDLKTKILISTIVILIIVLIVVAIYKPASPSCPSCPGCPDCPNCPKQVVCPVVNNFPTSSGKFYIQSKATNLFLNVDGTMVQDKTDATPFDWDSTTKVLTPKIGGDSVSAIPTDCGMLLYLTGYYGTVYSLATETSGVPITAPKTSGKFAINRGTLAANSDGRTLQPIQYYANFVMA